MDKALLIDRRFEQFLLKCKNYTVQDIDLLKQTFRMAEEASRGVVRHNSDPFIFHALNSAEILIDEFSLSANSIAASFIHEARRVKPSSSFHLDLLLPEVLAIAHDLDQIAAIDIKTTSLQVENFRKLVVSLSTDPRVILIKLADRLEVMRSLNTFPKSKQSKKSNETLLLYAPLAHQLGLYKVKSELEDLALRYTEPESYWSIVTKLKTSDKERNAFIEQFIEPIKTELNKQDFNYSIKSRTKSVYSIWKKMVQQQVPFERVYDVFAIRILIDIPLEQEKEACWKSYSIVTNLYTPNPKRLRDWISSPRSTGYESLHITVDDQDGKTVEVQIRTNRMDEIAESGIAAHWKYKGVKQIQSVQQWLDRVKELLSTPADIEKDRTVGQVATDEVFVYTPNGDLRQLPLGASVLDFAFDIHTKLGSRCVGATVNNKNVSIKDKLKTGDVVEIQTSKNQAPKQDWLNYVVTSKAKTRIRQSIREEEMKLASLGKELLERRLKNWKLSLTDEMLGQLVKHYKLKIISDLYAQLAADKINLNEIKEFLLASSNKPTEVVIAPVKHKTISNTNYLEIDEQSDAIAFKLSKCCNPIFGDEIFGFITIKEGVKIHRLNCPNASRLVEHYSYRIVKTKWREASDHQAFQATLRINGFDQHGLVAHISEIILKNTGLSVRSVDITNSKKGFFEARVKVFLSDKKQLDRLIVSLQQVKGIERVVRLSN